MPFSTSSRVDAWKLCATPPEGMTKRRPWVLDSGTKGTGAEMVPLDKVLKKPAPSAGAGLRSAQASPPTRRGA